MFKEALQGVVDGVEGGMAGLLMDFEGIPLESYARGESVFDIETVGAEVSVVVKAIQRASEMLDAGDTKEVAFKSAKMITLIRVLNENYFVALTMTPGEPDTRSDLLDNDLARAGERDYVARLEHRTGIDLEDASVSAKPVDEQPVLGHARLGSGNGQAGQR